MCIMSIKCRWHSTPFLIGRAYISFIIAVVTDDPFINILRFISQLTNNYDTDWTLEWEAAEDEDKIWLSDIGVDIAINRSGHVGGGNYVQSSGHSWRILGDLLLNPDEVGLKGDQVTEKSWVVGLDMPGCSLLG